MGNWRECKIEEMPQERCDIRVRCTAKILGLEMTPEWTTGMRLCGMGHGPNQWWPDGLHHWNGYRRYFIAPYEWREIEEGDADGVTWHGLDLLPCPFTGKQPIVGYTGIWTVAPPNKAESLSLKSQFVNQHGFRDAAKMRDAWNTRTAAPTPSQGKD